MTIVDRIEGGDAPNTGVIVMRMLSKQQVRELVLYSPQHIARLEAAGQFPKERRVP